MKNFWFMTIIMIVSSICKSPIATWFLSKKPGRGQPHIMCPMETYMSTIKKPSDAISRFFRTGVSLSLSASSSADFLALGSCLPLGEASYPASRTAAIIFSAEAVPSTPMEFVSRLTEQELTPLTPDTAFSTLAEQAAQLMPVTVYCSIVFITPSFIS